MRKWIKVVAVLGITAAVIILGITVFSNRNGEIPIPSESLSVAFMTGSDSIGNGGVNDEIWLGLEECKEEYGIKLRLYQIAGTSNDFAQYEMAAMEGADLILVRSKYAKEAIGYIEKLNAEYPNVRIAVIDDECLADKPEIKRMFANQRFPLNVEWLDIKYEELVFLSTYLASLETSTGNIAVCVSENPADDVIKNGFEAAMNISRKDITGIIRHINKKEDIEAVIAEFARQKTDVVIMATECNAKKVKSIGKKYGVKVITELGASYAAVSRWAAESMAPDTFRPGFFRVGYSRGAVFINADEMFWEYENRNKFEKLTEELEEDELTVPYTKFMLHKYIKEVSKGGH